MLSSKKKKKEGKSRFLWLEWGRVRLTMKLGAYISREEMKEVCGGSSVSYTLSVKMPRKIWRGMMWKVFLADCSSATI